MFVLLTLICILKLDQIINSYFICPFNIDNNHILKQLLIVCNILLLTNWKEIASTSKCKVGSFAVFALVNHNNTFSGNLSYYFTNYSTQH